MKKTASVIVLLCTLLLLFGCSSKQKSTTAGEKNELEKIGLTYGQSQDFDKFCSAFTDSIEKLNDFSYKVETDYSSLTETSNTDVLLSVEKIEAAYLDNGGKKQDEIVKFLQESNLGFFGIAQNVFNYQRPYTLTEATLCIQGMAGYVAEIGENYSLDSSGVNKLKKYFLDNINPKGNFIPAVDNVVKEIK